MTLSNYQSKLNWRLIFIHFAASWFIYHALWQLSYLCDYTMLEKIAHHDFTGFGADTTHRMSMIRFRAAMFRFAGILIGFAISLLLSLKYKWYWVNAVIVAIITFIFMLLDRFYYSDIRFIFEFPGKLFKPDWAFILTNGLVMLTIGIVLFFLKRLVRYINGN